MTLTELFTNIADAIRTKKGTSDKILATDFATEIENLPSGGGGEKMAITDARYLFAYRGDEIVGKANNYFDFSKCTDFSNCFYYSTATKIPLINTNKGTNFRYMFSYCTTEIPLIDTSNGTDFYNMFSYYTGEKIPLIDIRKATDVGYMFSNSTAEIPSLDFSNIKSINRTFYGYGGTKIAELDFSKVNYMASIFQYSKKTVIELGGFKNLGKAYTTQKAGIDAYRLDLSNETNLSHDSLMNVINKVYDLNLTYNVANGGVLYSQNIWMGSENKAKLTAEEIAIATAKRMVC